MSYGHVKCVLVNYHVSSFEPYMSKYICTDIFLSLVQIYLIFFKISHVLQTITYLDYGYMMVTTLNHSSNIRFSINHIYSSTFLSYTCFTSFGVSIFSQKKRNSLMIDTIIENSIDTNFL